MERHDVKRVIDRNFRPVIATLTSITFCFSLAWMYFIYQERDLQKRIEYGRVQLQQADGILRNGPVLLNELRVLARTNSTIRWILSANEFPLEPMPGGSAKP